MSGDDWWIELNWIDGNNWQDIYKMMMMAADHIVNIFFSHTNTHFITTWRRTNDAMINDNGGAGWLMFDDLKGKELLISSLGV